MTQENWDSRNIPDQTGRTVIVTVDKIRQDLPHADVRFLPLDLSDLHWEHFQPYTRPAARMCSQRIISAPAAGLKSKVIPNRSGPAAGHRTKR